MTQPVPPPASEAPAAAPQPQPVKAAQVESSGAEASGVAQSASASASASDVAASAAATPTSNVEKTFYKRRRVEPAFNEKGAVIPVPSAADSDDEQIEGETVNEVLIQFQSTDGVAAGPQLSVPARISQQQLQTLINQLLANEESVPYSFFVSETEVTSSLRRLIREQSLSTEQLLSITYQPQSIFRVQSVSRCTATISGHTQPVLSVAFSADGQQLASGAGDGSVRLWDVNTATPLHTLPGHSGWVLSVAYSANGRCLASGCMSGEVRIWSAETGKSIGKPLQGHRKWITSLAWEPFLTNTDQSRLASASKDGDVRIWDLKRRICQFTLSGHTQAIKCIVWGGQQLLYSASQDRTIKVWSITDKEAKLVRTLDGHAHWVNHLSISTQYALRINAYSHKGVKAETLEEQVKDARKRYDDALAVSGGREMLVSCSDDFTLFLWDPANSKSPIHRMTGHQQPINHCVFSPNGRLCASVSFDKSIRLWNGTTGAYIATFRGHVQAVYQCCWSADSRLLCSASKDSTIKCWDTNKKIMCSELPGHADEVFAVDWSPDGKRIASGGKDRVLKLWCK